MKKSLLQTNFDSPDESPGFLLWQISNKWQGEQRQALAAFDLTHVQFVLLACLVWAMGKTALTQKELALRAKTDVMMTSQVVRALECKGLLTRTTNTSDGRAVTLRPTKAGIRLVNKAIKAVEAVDRCFFQKLGDDSQAFTEMMRQLLARFPGEETQS